MSSCFHLAMATQTLDALCREKALSVLPNRSMVEDGSGHPGVKIIDSGLYFIFSFHFILFFLFLFLLIFYF